MTYPGEPPYLRRPGEVYYPPPAWGPGNCPSCLGWGRLTFGAVCAWCHGSKSLDREQYTAYLEAQWRHRMARADFVLAEWQREKAEAEQQQDTPATP